MDKISITDLLRELRSRGIIINYNTCWRAACEGRIPAQRVGSRWFVKASDLDRVAQAFAPVEQ